LHLIRPLGFSTDEKYLRRSGLDYWHTLDIVYHDCFASFAFFCGEKYPNSRLWIAETSGGKIFTEVKYGRDDFILFGSESGGIPKEILRQHSEHTVRVPMKAGVRSLNLSVAAGIVLYEALKQNGFPGLG
jgi:tRNA (cytidine/uridine-2'-O-)-methyltransferase